MPPESTEDPSEVIMELINEFLDRAQRGEKPSIEKYCESHPELADEIRDLFPALQVMEDLQPTSEPAESTVESQPAFPEQIGDYRIIGEIGRGGMGVVYEAEQQSLGRRVALKVLPDKLPLSDSARIRFQREARAAARMHHTNIVPVFEVGQDDGCFFYAMQLIQGQGLDDIIDALKHSADRGTPGSLHSAPSVAIPSTPMTDSTSSVTRARLESSSSSSRHQFYRSIAKIALQAAEALSYAHTRGVIHRDIKPSNLLVDGDGVLWVADFGLAKSENEEATLTQSGDFLGTLRYMSPERFRGECDARADIYALGTTIYELLLQTPAFSSADRMKLIYLISNTDPARPRSIDHRVPRDLETIILKSIEREPGQRYANAREMWLDLQRFVHDEPIRARRVSLFEKTVRWTKRNRLLAAMTAAMALVLLATLIGSSLAARHFRQLADGNEILASKNAALAKERTSERDAALEAERKSRDAEQMARVAEADARNAERKARDAEKKASDLAKQNERDLYAAEIILAAGQSHKPGGIRSVRQLLRKWIPTSDGQIDHRGPEWDYLYGLGRDNFQSLDGLKGLTVDFSPDGALIAVIEKTGALTVRDVTSGSDVLHVKQAHAGEACEVAFSHDGERLVTAGKDGAVRIWDVPGGKKIADLKGHEKYVFCAEFSRDSKYLASGGLDGVRIWSMESLEQLHHFLPSQGSENTEMDSVPDLDWHPTHNVLVTISNSDYLAVWDAVHGQRLEEYDWLNTLPELEFWFANKSVSWSPTGDRILACGMQNVILHLPTEDSPATASLFDPIGGEVSAAEWMPDGTQIVTAGESLELVVRDAETTEQVQRLRGHEGAITDISVSSDGKRIVSVSTDGTTRIWNASRQRRHWAEGAVAISPDSQRVAVSGGSRKAVIITDVDSGKVIRRIVPPKKSWIGFAAFSPDGERLAVGFGNGIVDSLVYVWHVETGELQATLDVGATYVQAIAWHPTEDDILAVAQNANGPMEIWNVSAQKLVESHAEYITWTWNSLQWHPDGRQLALVGWRPQIVDWESRQVSQTLSEQHTHNATSVCYSQDGTLLATAGDDGLICIYNVKNWSHVLTLRGHAGPIREIVWNPEATRIASLGADNTLRFWNVEVDEESGLRHDKVVLSLDAENGKSLHWSADGRFVVVSINKRLRVLKMFY